MRKTRTIASLVATLALASACQVGGGLAVEPARSPRPSAGPRTTPRPSPSPSRAPASRAPGPVASTASAAPVAPSAAPAAPARLQKPATPTLALRGTIRIDAAYALGAAGSLIANNGGGIVSNNGSSVLAFADVGLLANNGGNLISNNGGGLISDRGAGLTSKTKFALAQAPAAPAAQVGEVLPAAGILVEARSLRDGAPVALGVDGAGEPVFAIRADATGSYEVYVPADLAGNVLVTARVPEAEDPRLRYEILAPVAATEARAIDEDTTLVSRYLRRAYVGVLTDVLTAPDIEAMVALFETYDNLPDGVLGFMTQVAREFRVAADAAGLTAEGDAATKRAVAERMADVFAARLDMDGVTIGPEAVPVGGSRRPEVERLQGEKVVALGTRIMKAMRERSTELLRADPGFFERQAWFTTPNADRVAKGLAPIAIKRPSDVGLFFVDVYLVSTNRYVYEEIDAAVATMGITGEPATGVRMGSALFGVANAGALSIGAVMFGDAEAKAEAMAVIAGWRTKK